MTSKFPLAGSKNWMDKACDMFPKYIIHPYSIEKYKTHRIFVSTISKIFCFQTQYSNSTMVSDEYSMILPWPIFKKMLN